MSTHKTLKFPLAFKGPKGQIEQHFSESLIYQALLLVLDLNPEWRHSEASQTARLLWPDDTQTQLKWPMGDDDHSDCSCLLEKPCAHMAALALMSKSKLDQLPPFTNQLRQSSDHRMAFMHWLQRQSHDPFPNMARHRVVYLLNQNEHGHWTVSIHKAYLSQEEQYQIKSDINTSLLSRKTKPKFLSLTDQAIFHALHLKGLKQAHTFHLEAGDDAILELLLASKRLMWRACYRPPIEKKEASKSTDLPLIKGWFIHHNHHLITQIEAGKAGVRMKWQKGPIEPRMIISSHESHLPWQSSMTRFHWAQVMFKQGGVVFSLKDLFQAVSAVPETVVDGVAAWCTQIEKLPSIHASFEPPIAAEFDVNDRSLGADITAHAPLILALQAAGWEVVFDDGFQLNQKQANDWYVSLDGDEGHSWFDLELGVKVDGEKVNVLPYLIKMLKSGGWNQSDEQVSLRMDNGQHIGVENQTVKHIIQTLTELYDEQALTEDQQLRIESKQWVRLKQLKGGGLPQSAQWLGDDWLKEKASQLEQVDSLSMVEQPSGLKAELRDYQKTGLAWLQFLRAQSLGGVLADDMGLGKTLQALAHLLLEKKSGRMQTPCLVVAPTSLLGNWQAECHRFTPALSTLMLMGHDRKQWFDQLNRYDVVITSYGTLARDHAQLKDINFHCLILDEAQAIKNHKTMNAQVVKQMSAKQRLCLSGTPIENHLGELWSLFDFLMPGFLGSHQQFQHLFQWPIEKEKDPDRLDALKQRVGPLMLRRRKGDVVKELPDKMTLVTKLNLGEQQANVYESIRLSMSDEIQRASKQSQNLVVNNALLRLRQVCCHPGLLHIESAMDTPSVKLDWLSNVVPNMIESGRRILLFSSFTQMLALIEQRLNELGISTLKLTGQTPSAKRPEMVSSFQAGEAEVFLISLKAGGAGLNLTAADTVIQFDPWWNPAAEQQAADRAHRIGQDKQVFVYQLITAGTVEEKIHNMQQNKQQLSDGIWQQQKPMETLLKSQNWDAMFSPITQTNN